MAKFTCACIGLGNIGLRYDLSHKQGYILTHTKAYLKHPHCKLIFGVDKDIKCRKSFERYAKLPAYKTINDAKKAFDHVDIVSICVPLGCRDEAISDAVSLRPKVILLEKPLAADTAQAKKIIALCRNNNIKLCVNYLRRFEKNTFVIKSIIQNNTFGKLLHVDMAYNRGFLNNGSHFIDMLLYLLGKPEKFNVIRKSRTGNDCSVDVILLYKRLEAHCNAIDADVPIGEMHFWFEKGKIEYKKFGLQILYYKIGKDKVFKQFSELALYRTVKSALPYVMYDVMENVCNFLRHKERLLSTDINALEVLKICEDIVKRN
jgi:predicted dehydrogenase